MRKARKPSKIVGSAEPHSLEPLELLKIANIGKNDLVVRSYFASLAELAERDGTSETIDSLYLQGLNDALDAYLRFDERRSRIERAIRKIGSIGSHGEERKHLEDQLKTVRDDVARQMLRNALEQLERRASSFDALAIDMERIEARKAMIAQQMAAVRELLIRDNLITSEGTADGGGLALLRELNDDLAKDAIFTQQAEAEHILMSMVPNV